MKKVINGKVYNTETAKEIYSDWNGQSGWTYYSETLFKSKKGVYFICESGGPMTHMAVPCGNNTWSGSSEIYLLSIEKAKKWLEEKNAIEELVEEFSDIIEV